VLQALLLPRPDLKITLGGVAGHTLIGDHIADAAQFGTPQSRQLVGPANNRLLFQAARIPELFVHLIPRHSRRFALGSSPRE
jgi:hypothetical protein